MIKEFIFLGTGTSGNIPSVGCLTATPITCLTCLSAMQFDIPPLAKGQLIPQINYSKDRRRNTSAMVRYLHSDGTLKNILIDCGKTFYESALMAFTTHALRKIDGVILTHPHADAIMGLDDLRQWTMNGRVQDSIDIYLTQETFERVEASFPYMVDKAHATGSGEIATVKFHVFDQAGVPDHFYVDELKVIPIPVQHGLYSDGRPFMSMGYRFGDLTYISDVNFVPPESMEKIQGSSIVIVDALKNEPHASHFSYEQALDFCLTVLPDHGRGYFTGLCHLASHDTVNQWIQKSKSSKKRWVPVEVAFDMMKIHL